MKVQNTNINVSRHRKYQAFLTLTEMMMGYRKRQLLTGFPVVAQERSNGLSFSHISKLIFYGRLSARFCEKTKKSVTK